MYIIVASSKTVYKVPAVGVGPLRLVVATTPPGLVFQAGINGVAASQLVMVNNLGGGVLELDGGGERRVDHAVAGERDGAGDAGGGGKCGGAGAGDVQRDGDDHGGGGGGQPADGGGAVDGAAVCRGAGEGERGHAERGDQHGMRPPLVVKATAGDGSAAAGIKVGFKLASQPAGATGASLSAETATTDGTGQAQATLTLGNQPGAYKVEVYAAGLTSQTVTFTATATATVGAVSATATTVTATPNNLAADGSSRSQITVIPRDGSGLNLGAGQTVTLSKTGGGTLSAVADKGDGSYTAVFTAPSSSGSASISAVVNGVAIQQTAAVSFSSGTVPIIVAGAEVTGWPNQLAVDGADNLYVGGGGVVRIEGVSGESSVVVSGQGNGVAVDRWGSVYYTVPGRVLKKEALSGATVVVAGTGVLGVGNEEGPAVLAAVDTVKGKIAVDGAGNVYVAEGREEPGAEGRGGDGDDQHGGGRGTGGDGGAATRAAVVGPAAVAVDREGNLYISEAGSAPSRVRKVDGATGVITTVAGGGTGGDGGAATQALLTSPEGVAVDRWGNLYVAEYNEQPSAAGGCGKRDHQHGGGRREWGPGGAGHGRQHRFSV